MECYSAWSYGNLRASLLAQMVKNPPAMQETWVQSPDWDNPLKKGMVTHSIILAWRIPWTEEASGLQSTGSQRVGYNWATNTFTFLSSLGRRRPHWMHGLVNRMQLNINSPSQSRPWPQEGTSWVGHNVNNCTSSPGAEYLKELKMPVKRFIFLFSIFL